MDWRKQQPLAMTICGLATLVLGVLQTHLAQAQGPTQETECDALAETINQNVAFMTAFEVEILTFSQNASQAETLADITAAADQYVTAVEGVVTNLDGLAIELGDVPILDADLSDYRDAYAILVARFADALETAGTAMEIVATTESEAELLNNLEALQSGTNSALEQIQGLTNREAEVIAGVNTYCGYNP